MCSQINRLPQKYFVKASSLIDHCPHKRPTHRWGRQSLFNVTMTIVSAYTSFKRVITRTAKTQSTSWLTTSSRLVLSQKMRQALPIIAHCPHTSRYKTFSTSEKASAWWQSTKQKTGTTVKARVTLMELISRMSFYSKSQAQSLRPPLKMTCSWWANSSSSIRHLNGETTRVWGSTFHSLTSRGKCTSETQRSAFWLINVSST